MPDDLTVAWRNRYDTAMEALFEVALELRKIAAGVARVHREHAALAGTPEAVRTAA